MHPPLRLEGPAYAGGAALDQRCAYAQERLQRVGVDAFGGHHDQPPPSPVQLLAPGDVSEPLLGVVGVLATVVLDDKPKVFVRRS